MPAKVEIKSYKYARECVSFVHACMYVPIQLELCLYDQTQIIANAACRVGSQQFLSQKASYFFSLLFIAIPTSFLNL